MAVAKSVTCGITEKKVPLRNAVPADSVPDGISKLILKDHPAWTREGYICRDTLTYYRNAYIRDVLVAEKGELSALDQEVVRSLEEQAMLTSNVNADFESKLTFGQRVADRTAAFGGSWRFIFAFGGLILLWVVFNTVPLLWRPFDPYPFIFLNLVLSCLAAVQAPIIMMSQNRWEARDRVRSENDYKVNLKAELEIRHIHEKIDYLLHEQWKRLMEIQEIQVQLMDEMVGKKSPRRGPRTSNA